MKTGKGNKGKFGKVRKSSENIDDYELNDTGNNILNLSLQFPDITDTEIAKRLNITNDWVYKVKKTPAYIKAKRETDIEARQRIKGLLNKAVDKIDKLLDSHNEKIVLDTAKIVLGNVLDPKNINLTVTDLTKIKEEFRQLIGG